MVDIVKIEKLTNEQLRKFYAAQVAEHYPSVTLFEETKSELRKRKMEIASEDVIVHFKSEGYTFKVTISGKEGKIKEEIV